MYIHFEYMNLSKFSGPESDFNSVAYKKSLYFGFISRMMVCWFGIPLVGAEEGEDDLLSTKM